MLDEFGTKTGTYAWRDGRLVKISSRPRSWPTVDVYVPKGGYKDETLGEMVNGRWVAANVESREHKRALMRERGVVEDGGFNTPKRRRYFGAV